MNTVRFLLLCLALLTVFLPTTASAESAADTSIKPITTLNEKQSNDELVRQAGISQDELSLTSVITEGVTSLAEQSGFHPPPMWLIVISVAAFAMLALLMFRMSHSVNIEMQFGQKRFNRGLIGVLALVVGFVGVLSWWLLERNRQELDHHNQFNLEIALNITHERLNIWVKHHKTYLEQLTHYPELLSATERLLNVTPTADALISSAALVHVRRFIYSKERDFGKKGFFIINPDYTSIGSMRDRNLGTKNPIAERRADLLARVFQGETVFIPPVNSDISRIGDSTMFFAAPIRNLSGKVIAILTQRLDPLTGFSKLFDVGRIGGAGETYAFSREGVFLSESYFNEQLRRVGLLGSGQHSSLSVSIRDPGGNLLTGYKPETERYQQALTSMAASAVRGESDVNMRGYRNYRGVPVFGAWLWDSKLNMGLATEIAVEEALSPYYLIRGSLIGILIVTLMLSVGAVLFTLYTGERISKSLFRSNRALKFEIEEREKTETKLRDREVEVTSILATVGDGIVTMSDKGMVESFNPAAEIMFGYKASEVIGQPLSMLTPESIQHEKNVESHVNNGYPDIIGMQREIEAKRRDGSLFPVMIQVNRMIINGEVKYTSALHDITNRKRAEEALNRSYAEMESLVKERTVELMKAKDVAESASRAKSVFLSNMSHELRTPLNAILGFSDMLRRDKGLSKGQQNTLETIHTSGDHLLSIINNILDTSKIEASQVVLKSEPFDLGSMILDISDMLMIRVREKGLEFQVEQASDFPRYIVGDEARLRQILINLISNAINATGQGGIILRLKLKHNSGDHLLIDVEDSGIGIAPEDQSRVFEDFIQLETQDRQKGTGLGLPITYQLVKLMGGELTLTSTVGQGSTFRIDLPVQLAPSDVTPEATRTRGMITGLATGQPAFRILVVEDELDNQMLLGHLLEEVGFEVGFANNGAEAVEHFTRWHPHFIWMDQRMPVMDGAEATRRIRALPGGDVVKIAAVTASAFKDEIEALTAVGFDAVVHKPYQPEQIFECMERLLGLYFISDQVEGKETSLPELSPTDFAAIPEDLRQELEQALFTLNRERILRAIDTIAQTAPELGAALRGRAQNYDYKPIMSLL